MKTDYEANEVARFWNLLPWQFRTLSNDQQAELHAHRSVHTLIENYYDSEKARLYAKITK